MARWEAETLGRVPRGLAAWWGKITGKLIDFSDAGFKAERVREEKDLSQTQKVRTGSWKRGGPLLLPLP